MLEIGEQALPRTVPSMGCLYGHYDDHTRNPKFLGSGTFVRFEVDIFMLTAMHVVADSASYKYIFHDRGGDGNGTFPFRGGWVGHPEGDCDIALWGCFSEAFDGTDVVPIGLEEITMSNVEPDAMILCHGFPQDRELIFPHVREVRHTTHPAIGQNVDVGNSIDSKHHFAFGCAEGHNYRGMSGSAAWNLNVHNLSASESWSSEKVTFAGVVHRWNEEDNYLIATRAENVRNFLPAAIQILRDQWAQAE